MKHFLNIFWNFAFRPTIRSGSLLVKMRVSAKEPTKIYQAPFFDFTYRCTCLLTNGVFHKLFCHSTFAIVFDDQRTGFSFRDQLSLERPSYFLSASSLNAFFQKQSDALLLESHQVSK